MKFLLTIIFLCFAIIANAGSVILAWDPNPEPEIAGYTLFYGNQSGNYSSTIDVGNVVTYQVDGLHPETWFFIVKAYNTDGLMSPPSNEVNAKINGPPSAPKLLRISKVIASADKTKAEIKWITNIPSKGKVQYATSPSELDKTPLEKIDKSPASEKHTVNLNDLKRKQRYLFRITASKKDGALARADGQFSTK